MLLICENCGQRADDHDREKVVSLANTPNLLQRVAPGEPMPGGECRKCGSLMQPSTCLICGSYSNLDGTCPQCGSLHAPGD